jgi:AcrR family transcriptional regulator
VAREIGQFTRHIVFNQSNCPRLDVAYTRLVPKLWSETIKEHRREVREAIQETTVALVAERGLLSVTMSQIAEETGIGRATLYKYFPDVEAILRAWHERKINGHLGDLVRVREEAGEPGERLRGVLETYAFIVHDSRSHKDSELAALLHGDKQVATAEQQLRGVMRDLLTEGTKTGDVRTDVRADELASYCVHSLTAASTMPSRAAVRRLVEVTLAGLRPPGKFPP